MTTFRQCFSMTARTAAVLFWCAGLAASTAQEPKAKAKPEAASEAKANAPATPAAQSSMVETARLFPQGKPWEGVVIPRHNDKDELTNIIHAETLTRESDELMQLKGATVVFLQSDGSMNLRIKTAEGFYNILTERVTSRTKTFVEHPKFDMHGDSSVFDVKTQTGVLNGRVEMVIYSVETAALPIPASLTAPSHAAEPIAPSPEGAPSN